MHVALPTPLIIARDCANFFSTFLARGLLYKRRQKPSESLEMLKRAREIQKDLLGRQALAGNPKRIQLMSVLTP